jgi:histidinol-phosphatase (PHP family)
MDADYHVHSNYSDGHFLFKMARSADRAGLSAVGFADHCTVSERPGMIEQRDRLGFTLDATYERRRAAIEGLREREWLSITIYDAVEMDYHPADEDAVAAFLDDAGFDYAIGSVHHVDGVNVQATPYWEDKSDRERRAAVDRYFEHLVALVDSELFAVAAHPDLIERNRALAGFADADHYRAAADAFADSRTIPELNAGRVTETSDRFHPVPDFFETLRSRDLSFTVGTDSHEPGDVAPRVAALERAIENRGIEPVAPHASR